MGEGKKIFDLLGIKWNPDLEVPRRLDFGGSADGGTEQEDNEEEVFSAATTGDVLDIASYRGSAGWTRLKQAVSILDPSQTEAVSALIRSAEARQPTIGSPRAGSETPRGKGERMYWAGQGGETPRGLKKLRQWKSAPGSDDVYEGGVQGAIAKVRRALFKEGGDGVGNVEKWDDEQGVARFLANSIASLHSDDKLRDGDDDGHDDQRIGDRDRDRGDEGEREEKDRIMRSLDPGLMLPFSAAKHEPVIIGEGTKRNINDQTSSTAV